MATILSFRTGLPVEPMPVDPVSAEPIPSPAPAAPKPKTRPVPARRKRGAVDEEQRKAMLAKIHVAKKQLGLTEEEYRGMIDGLYSVDSAGKLDNRQLHGLLLAMGRVGFTATRGSARRGANRKTAIPALLQSGAPYAPARASCGELIAEASADGTCFRPHSGEPERIKDPLGRRPYMDKIEALLAEKGRIEGTHVPWGYAVGILKKQSGGVTKCFEHATPDQLRAVIAALTYDAKRRG